MIYNQDCLEGMRSLKENSIDLTVTSPPYNIGKEYENKLSFKDYTVWMGKVIKEVARVTSGSVVFQMGNYVNDGVVIPLDCALFNTFIENGLIPRNRIIWTFGHGLHCKKRFSGRHETLLWFTKSNDYTFNLDPVRVPQKYPNKKSYKGPNKGMLSGNPLGKNPGDVWDIPNVKNNHPEKTDHPCQYPLALVDRIILSMTNENDTVMDPFLGSGTTAESSVNNKRKFIGYELDESYISICEKRLLITQ